MSQKCPRCLQVISAQDTVEVVGNQVAHVDCRRPHDLTYEERALLFTYCFEHRVAECPRCLQGFRQYELGADLFGNHTHLCPRCRADLTETLRGHLYACAMLPEEVRRRAQALRDAARKLAKESSELRDHADVLMQETEAALAALRETMQRTAAG